MQAGVDQTRSVPCELWIQFACQCGSRNLEVSTAEEASQKAHAEVADNGLEDPEDDDDNLLLPQQNRPSPRKSTQVQGFKAADADEDELETSQAP